MPALEVRGLKKSFPPSRGFSFRPPGGKKAKEVLRDLSFCVPPAGVTGFLGSNGSGKTTTLKCVLGLTSRESGEVLFFAHSPLSPEVLRQVGFLPERPCFYDFLTGEETLLFYGRLSSSPRGITDRELKQRTKHLLKKMELYEVRNQKISTYSRGMLQKLGLAQALVHRPQLVILDEPLAGLDPGGRCCVKEALEGMVKEEGACVFFSSHLLYDVEKLCQNVVIIQEGKTLYQGLLSDLLQEAQETYRIEYLKKGNKHSLCVSPLQEMLKKLDQLKREPVQILNLDRVRGDLEQVFTNRTQGGSAKDPETGK